MSDAVTQNLEQKLEQSLSKLLTVFDTAITKATGPEAVSLLYSFMTYIRIEQIVDILTLFVVTFLAVWLPKKYAKKTFDALPGGFEPLMIFPAAGWGILVTHGLIILSNLPKTIAILIDPRLYFVFKLLK